MPAREGGVDLAEKKRRVAFLFVEAGLGHIMPMNAVCTAFEKKYGDRVDIIRTYFYQDTQNPDMKYVENELIKEVKNHNKNRFNGIVQFLGMRLCGTRASMKYLMEIRYKRGFQASLDYMETLDADLIFNTHFSTLYAACEARSRGLIRSKIMTYCPDPVLGQQWDRRGDVFALSSASGRARAMSELRLRKKDVFDIPFLIRKEVAEYNQGKAYYRKQLGLPEDNFTILLADGAYGAGKLRKTVYELLKSKHKLTILAVCGKNEELYREFSAVQTPEHITFVPFGFTDKTLMLAASCDLFMGKAGASNLAEPIHFGAPAIVTFRATKVEKWISAHHEKAGCAIRMQNVKKAVRLAESFAENPALMEPYRRACLANSRVDGPEILADLIWQNLEQPRTVAFRKVREIVRMRLGLQKSPI